MARSKSIDDLNVSLRKKVDLQRLMKVEQEARNKRQALVKLGAQDTSTLVKTMVKDLSHRLKTLKKIPELQRVVWREVYHSIPKSTRGRKPHQTAA